MVSILDLRMADGSRHFGDLPATQDWFAVRAHVAALPGAVLTEFVCDGVTEAWIDFNFRGQHFSMNDQMGEYWFFVRDPGCPDEILALVLTHFSLLLGA